MERIMMIAALAVFGGFSAAADEIQELRDEVRQLLESLNQLNSRIDALESENARLMDGQENLKTEVANIPEPAPSRNQGFNPDIGVVFDTVGTLTEQDPDDFEEDEGFDRFSVREIELNIGHDIDPYTRFDSTITFSDFEDVDIEEAYVSYSRLPLETAGRVGRFRLPIGLANPYHRDQLFSVDEPLVVQRYLGVEGLFRTGVELSRFLPQFDDRVTQHLRIGLVEGGIGENGTLFGESRQEPTYYGRFGNEFGVSPSGTLQLGVSYLAGNSGDSNNDVDVQAWGFDAQYQHQFRPYQQLTLQAETLLQDRDDALTPSAEDNPFGYYLLANYRATQRWGFGGRFDDVEVADFDPFDPDEPHLRDNEKAYSAWLTFHQSEFARWRIQYEHVELADGLDDDRLMLQGTFFIGWHQHAVKN